MLVLILELGIAVAIFASLAIAWFAGKLIGRRLHSQLSEHPQFGVVQGAIFALLGLLLGFCFAGAISRFVARQDVIVQEGNAISSCYAYADLLAPPHDQALRIHLRTYANTRLELFGIATSRDDRDIQDRLSRLQNDMWSTAVEGTRATAHHASIVLPRVNDIGDLLAIRNAGEHNHIPVLVLVILLASAQASIATIGLGIELADKRLRLPAAVLAFLIAATLWTTLDLDFPRIGLARASSRPLREAIAFMESFRPAPRP